MKEQKQIEITVPSLMLDENGYPACPGYSRHSDFIYNKENIKKRRSRIKEWDFYLVTDGRYKAELNFFNVSYAAAMTAEVVDLKTGVTYLDSAVCPSNPDKFTLNPGAAKPFVFTCKMNGKSIFFETKESSVSLKYQGRSAGKSFYVFAEGQFLPGHESLSTLTPFRDRHCFYLTEKMNCIEAECRIRAGGKTVVFDSGNTFITIDRGRGLWPYRNEWIWANASGRVNGRLFGIEITYGFGDESFSTATAIFYDGKCHKIGAARLVNEPDEKYKEVPLRFLSEDGRLDLTLTPEAHHADGLLVADRIGHSSYQTYGHLNGTAVLDDGTVIEVKDIFGFVEKVRNGW